MAGRALGFTAAALILVLVGAVVYALMRRATPPATNTPAEVSSPLPANPPLEQTNQNLESKDGQPPNVEPAAAPKRVAGSDKNGKRTASSSTPKDARVFPKVPNPPDTQVGPPAPDPRNENPYWDQARIDEERRRAMRRALEAERKAERERRRAQQIRRRTRQTYPKFN